MKCLEIVTENVEVFRIPFTHLEEFHIDGITESIDMDSNHNLYTYKVAGSVYIRISSEANRKLPYDEEYLFSRLIRYRDITSLEIFTAPDNLASDAPAKDQQNFVSYFVPWGEDDNMINSLADVNLERDGSLFITISD